MGAWPISPSEPGVNHDEATVVGGVTNQVTSREASARRLLQNEGPPLVRPACCEMMLVENNHTEENYHKGIAKIITRSLIATDTGPGSV